MKDTLVSFLKIFFLKNWYIFIIGIKLLNLPSNNVAALKITIASYLLCIQFPQKGTHFETFCDL